MNWGNFMCAAAIKEGDIFAFVFTVRRNKLHVTANRLKAHGWTPFGSAKKQKKGPSSSEVGGKDHGINLSVSDAALETLGKVVHDVPGDSTQLYSDAATPIDPTESQTKTPANPPGYPLIPTVGSEFLMLIFPLFHLIETAAKKNNGSKKSNTKP